MYIYDISRLRVKDAVRISNFILTLRTTSNYFWDRVITKIPEIINFFYFHVLDETNLPKLFSR